MKLTNCKCGNCGKKMVRRVCELQYYKTVYCGKKCKNEAAIKYDAAALEYVKQNINKVAFSALAAHLKTTFYGLKKQLTKWRRAGEPIPKLKYEGRGIRKRRDKESKEPRIVPVFRTDNMKRPIDKRKTNGASQIKPAEEKKMIIKDFNPSIHTYVRVDSRTWVIRKKELVASDG